MKTFLKKYFNQAQLSENELVEFIVKFCEKKGKSPSSEQLPVITNMVKMGIINLESVCKEACELENLQLYAIEDMNRIVKCYKIIDNEK